MVDNYQQLFEDRDFCLEALRWCLLVVARVGMLNSTATTDIFVKHWTTFADTNATLSRDLGVAEEE